MDKVLYSVFLFVSAAIEYVQKWDVKCKQAAPIDGLLDMSLQAWSPGTIGWGEVPPAILLISDWGYQLADPGRNIGSSRNTNCV